MNVTSHTDYLDKVEMACIRFFWFVLEKIYQSESINYRLPYCVSAQLWWFHG
jgi:hypothetical protein